MRWRAAVWSVGIVLASLAGCSDEPVEGDVQRVECRLNSDCPQGQLCVDDACIEDEEACEGEDCPCLQDSDCGVGEACELASGACFALECLRDEGCALGEVCLAGRCETDVDADRDRDGVPDTEDLCPEIQDAAQEDNDGDGRGDACDDDDDDDGRSDTIDNCPTVHNPLQGDADGNGLGNACDENTPGIGLEGRLDFTALPGANTANAQVFIGGRTSPEGIDESGAFAFDAVLEEPGRYLLSVVWPGFVSVVQEFEAPDGQPVVVIPPLALTPAVEGDDTVETGGSALLQGASDHSGVVVRARVGGALVATTLTDAEGRFALAMAPVDHDLSFSKTGFVSLDVTALFNTQGPLEGQFTVDGVPLEEAPIVLAAEPTARVQGALISPLTIDDFTRRSLVVLSGEGVQRVATVSNDDGRGLFEIAGLRPGQYALNIQVLGHLSEVLSLDVPVEGVQDLEVSLTPERVRFSGAVEAGGRALDAVVVRARRGQVLADTTLSDEQGRFSLDLTPEAHTVTLSKQGFQAHPEIALNWNGERFEVEAEEGEPPFVLVPVPQSTLSGEVESVQGPRNDWPNVAFVTLTGGDERRIVPVANADGGRGQFQFVALPPGAYDLSVVAQGHEPFNQSVVLVDGDNEAPLSTLQIEANETAVVLQGRVSLQGEEEDGDHSGVAVRASVQGNTVTTSQTDTDGVFAFLASRQDHALSFSKQNTIPRDILVTWNEVLERFEFEGQPLSEQVVELTQTPQSDRDADGVLDALDNCPQTFNVDQRDTDGDGQGDTCDGDLDGDGMINGLDNCPLSFNPMQEDPEGLGRGLACSKGDLDDPLALGCGVELQALDSRERPSALLASCGGAGAPEVVYALDVAEGEQWTVRVDANHTVVLYLLDAQDRERACHIGGRATFAQGDTLPVGQYRLVVDGFSGRESAGPMTVSIRSKACGASFGQRSGRVGFMRDPGSVLLGDISGDDDALDFLTIGRDPDRGQVLYGDGAGGFIRGRNLLTSGRGSAAALGDFNSDGVTDVAIAHDGDALSLFRGNGRRGFFTETAFAVGENPVGLAAADFDGDGNLDAATINNGSADISVLLGDGLGGFADAVSFEVGGSPGNLVAGDLNGDGRPDLAFRADDSSVGVSLNNGEGVFGATERFASGDGLVAVGLLDANRDGALDVVTGNRDSQDISVLMGDGRGRLLPQQTHSAGGVVRHMALGDADGDGIKDVTVALNTTHGTFFGDGYGGFSAPQISEINGRRGPTALGDVDGDGFTDFVTTDFVGNGANVSFGEAEGLFGLHEPLDAVAGPHSVVLGHLNGDAHLDLVSANSATNNVVVRMGDGRGGFSEPQTHGVGTFPRAVSLDDFNGDAHLDVFTTDDIGTGYASLLLGDGAGHFSPHKAFGVGDFPRGAGLGDLDGDGRLDAVVANEGSDTISVLRQRALQRPGTRLVNASLPPCEASQTPLQALTANSQGFLPEAQAPCRIDRLELDLSFDPEAFGALSLETPLGQVQPLRPLSSSPGVWRPEDISDLARLETHPLGGPWTVAADFVLDSAQMWVNSFPTNPFDPEALAALCSPDADQLSEPAFVCRLPSSHAPPAPEPDSPDDDFVLTNDGDEDVFLLEGDFGGAFIQGQTLVAIVTADTDSDLDVELRAFRARNPLAVAQRVGDGVWSLSWTVPSEYSGRFFTVHVQGQGVDGLAYDLRAGLGEPLD